MPGSAASSPPHACFPPPRPRSASGCAASSSRDRRAWPSTRGRDTTSLTRHPRPSRLPCPLRETLPRSALAAFREFDLPIGHDALERIWRAHGLIHKRRRKYQRKQDLAHIKARWALFQQISADTKDLDDIPRYWTQAQQLQLPVVQYTARDVRSGLLFWAFAQGRSASASAVFAARIQQHLQRCGVSLRDLVWQTDNGGEFKGDFPQALGDSQHVRIPPAAHTYQSDVETVHRLEEDEFFDLEDFSSRGVFLGVCPRISVRSAEDIPERTGGYVSVLIMTKTFRTYLPEQELLLPASLREWLPDNHLAYFVSDVVDQLDLSAIECVYAEEDRGQPPYHPLMMTKILLYGYCVGVFSSRRIQKRLVEDVAFRVLAAGNQPDFRTISDFRKLHLKALEELFEQMLRLTLETGAMKLGRVALDGSKVKGNASKHKAVTGG